MTNNDKKLTLKQERFCQLYATSAEFFGNGARSYAEAYNKPMRNIHEYKVCQNGASENLSKPFIAARINELLSEDGLNDQFVDKQLLYLLTQHEDRGAKMAAIKEYNAVRGRIIKKLQATINPVDEILKSYLGGDDDDQTKDGSATQTSVDENRED